MLNCNPSKFKLATVCESSVKAGPLEVISGAVAGIPFPA